MRRPPARSPALPGPRQPPATRPHPTRRPRPGQPAAAAAAAAAGAAPCNAAAMQLRRRPAPASTNRTTRKGRSVRRRPPRRRSRTAPPPRGCARRRAPPRPRRRPRSRRPAAAPPTRAGRARAAGAAAAAPRSAPRAPPRPAPPAQTPARGGRHFKQLVLGGAQLERGSLAGPRPPLLRHWRMRARTSTAQHMHTARLRVARPGGACMPGAGFVFMTMCKASTSDKAWSLTNTLHCSIAVCPARAPPALPAPASRHQAHAHPPERGRAAARGGRTAARRSEAAKHGCSCMRRRARVGRRPLRPLTAAAQHRK